MNIFWIKCSSKNKTRKQTKEFGKPSNKYLLSHWDLSMFVLQLTYKSVPSTKPAFMRPLRLIYFTPSHYLWQLHNQPQGTLTLFRCDAAFVLSDQLMSMQMALRIRRDHEFIHLFIQHASLLRENKFITTKDQHSWYKPSFLCTRINSLKTV